MSLADTALQRAHAYLEDARDSTQDVTTRCEALDASRAALMDARRARAQPQHLLPTFTNICQIAAVDASYTIRCVVPQVIEELCFRDPRSFVPASTPFLARSLQDESVLVTKRAVRTLTTLFRKLIGMVVSVGVSDDGFPESRLKSWLQMQRKAISFIQVPDDGLRKAATKFAETVVLAFSYSGTSGSPDHFTLDYILKKPSACPLLNMETLEAEGMRCVEAVVTLIRKGLEGRMPSTRSDSTISYGLAPASFMTAVSVLSSLVRRRRKILQLTLPPLLSVVSGITGTMFPRSAAFHALTEGQMRSIISVLRYCLLALRKYNHANMGRPGEDLAHATNDLANYEKSQELMRKERANALAARMLSKKKEPAVVVASAADISIRGVKTNTGTMPIHAPSSLKRPRMSNANQQFPRLPADQAKDLALSLAQHMPRQEVVNFILTRLLLNIPSAETVPGAVTAVSNQKAVSSSADEPLQKRPRKSRFGTKDSERQSTAVGIAKKRVAVRKSAPPVVSVQLTPEATERLVSTICRRIMKREAEAISSGAGALRQQVLARLLTSLAQKGSKISSSMCEEACAIIANNIEHNADLAQAWLHSLVCAEEISRIGPFDDNSVKQKTTLQVGGIDGLAKALPSDSKVNPSSSPLLKSESTLEGDELTNNGNPVDIKMGEQNGSGEQTTSINEGIPKTENEIDPNVLAVNSSESKVTSSEVVEDDENLSPLKAGKAYEQVFTKLLSLMKGRQDLPSDFFSSLISDAPVLPPTIFDMLSSLCKDRSSIKLGLQAYYNIIVERYGEDRKKCLAMLLKLTFEEDEVVRGHSIRLIADSIYVECGGDVPSTIQAFATNALESAVADLDVPVTDEKINALDRASLLLTALCGQKHELLCILVTCYAKACDEGKVVLLRRSKDLAGHIGMSAEPILQLISGALIPSKPLETDSNLNTDGAEGLALEVLQALLKKFGKPSEKIVEAAIRRYERKRNINFIISVLPGLRKNALQEHLPALVEASVQNAKVEELRDATKLENGTAKTSKKSAGFEHIIGVVMGCHPPALSPVELLMDLHKIKASEGARAAIRACFELKAVYSQTVIAQAIQQLMELTVIPDLYMETIHLARVFHVELEKYLTNTVMMRLIEKKVWTNKMVWAGYLNYCGEIKERSIKLLIRLPAPQLEDALDKQAVLTGVFKDLISNPKAKKIPPKHRKIISLAIKKGSSTGKR